MGLFRRKPMVEPAQLAALATEVAQLRELLTDLSQRIDGGALDTALHRAALTRLEQRVGGLGAELANQIHELSGDINQLQARPNGASEDDVEQLRSGQDRLANEQARYQIAFREDLAALADKLSRPKPLR
jgi:chromosome segregation ATPase